MPYRVKLPPEVTSAQLSDSVSPIYAETVTVVTAVTDPMRLTPWPACFHCLNLSCQRRG
jgi:hypothetical protein